MKNNLRAEQCSYPNLYPILNDNDQKMFQIFNNKNKIRPGELKRRRSILQFGLVQFYNGVWSGSILQRCLVWFNHVSLTNLFKIQYAATQG